MTAIEDARTAADAFARPNGSLALIALADQMYVALRALIVEHERVTAEADEWEYGVTTMWGVQLRSSEAHAQEYAATVRRLIEERATSGDLRFHGNLRRRRPAIEAGPWEPVEAARDAT